MLYKEYEMGNSKVLKTSINRKVQMAEPFDSSETGSLGKADHMIIRQNNFPKNYHRDQDTLIYAETDRLQEWDNDRFTQTMKKFIKSGELGLIDKVMDLKKDGSHIMSNSRVMNFIKEALQVKSQYPGIKWTGFRITFSINRNNGNKIFCLWLFANESGAEVYSELTASNVKDNGHVPRYSNLGFELKY